MVMRARYLVLKSQTGWAMFGEGTQKIADGHYFEARGARISVWRRLRRLYVMRSPSRSMHRNSGCIGICMLRPKIALSRLLCKASNGRVARSFVPDSQAIIVRPALWTSKRRQSAYKRRQNAHYNPTPFPIFLIAATFLYRKPHLICVLFEV